MNLEAFSKVRKMRSLCRSLAVFWTSLFVLLTASPAEAQLSRHHYLAPVPGFRDGDIELQVWTPSPTPVAYTIRSASGGLRSNDMSIAAISNSVSSGGPVTHTFERTGNDSDSSGGLGQDRTIAPVPEEDYGFIVEAEAPVVVIMSSLHGLNRSIISAKGNNGVGTEFYAWSSFNTTGNSSGGDNDSAHFISIMAIEDATTVTIDGADVFEGFTPSVNNTVALDQYETFTIATATNTTLTGTHVVSDKPITVVGGDVHPQQSGQGERDGGADQLVPTRLAGTHYVVGNIWPHSSYGPDGDDGNPVGNRYVQLVAIEDNTQIEHYRADLDSTDIYNLASAGDVLVLPTLGGSGNGHFFASTGAGTTHPFLLFLNSSGEPAEEMGGTTVPALRGELSQGTFCSGTEFVEFASPPDVTVYMVYIPSDQLPSLELDIGAGWVAYDDGTIGADLLSIDVIDPDGAGGLDEISILRFAGDIVADRTRVAFQSSGRMHVAVGTAIPGSAASFGYFSDYSFGYQILDPVLSVATDEYNEPQTFADATPRAITHCIDVDSACSLRYSIISIADDRGGAFSNVTNPATVDEADPCFDYTPVPVPGAGPQEYIVSATVQDETGAEREVDIYFTFTWLDDEGDGIPDALDIDDDNDGISDVDELGGVDLSGDTDLDQVPDWNDPDFVTCVSTDGIACDEIPTELDRDGDGIPNHLDLDSDGDSVWDFIEGNDQNQDGINDNPSVSDANNDGVIDTVVDADQNGRDDSYDATPPALQNSDMDGQPDYLDTDDDGDGLLTLHENYNGGSPVDDDTDSNGVPDYLDPDDDGDGVPTESESPDPNGDGDPADAVDSNPPAPPDYLDPNVIAPTDSDGDGIPDVLDEDDDNDGIPDSVEGDGDDDGDGIINRVDLDSDNDGITDLVENGLGALDEDGDGRIDDQTDSDADGIVDGAENAPDDRDTDSDGIPDRLDADSDGDGIPDAIEGGGVDADSDGRVDSTEDADGDGLMAIVDPDEGGSPLSIPNSDGRGDPDFQDLDSDGDGVPDLIEGHDSDSDGEADIDPTGDDMDGDGLDDAFDTDDDGEPVEPPDRDGDSIPDFQDVDDDGDSVHTEFEDLDGDGDPTNDDTDGDGTPDYLDPDDDGDGILTIDEDPDPNGDGNPDDAVTTGGNPDYLDPNDAPVDTDGDGIPDDVECPGNTMPDTDGDGQPDCQDDDDDGDGVSTVDERPMGDQDTDDDGTPDHLDPDDDGDGVPTEDELDPEDTDGDGTPDYLDPDDDGDGVPTEDELDPEDTDGDGTPDYLDPDDDGDGIPTEDELEPGDTDDDGTPDYLDPDDDGDTIPTSEEGDRDTDGDGIPDYLDVDDDGDGILTEDEPTDADGNGVPDYLEVPKDGATPGKKGASPSLLGGGFSCSTGTDQGGSSAPLLLLFGLGSIAVLRRRRRAA